MAHRVKPTRPVIGNEKRGCGNLRRRTLPETFVCEDSSNTPKRALLAVAFDPLCDLFAIGSK